MCTYCNGQERLHKTSTTYHLLIYKRFISTLIREFKYFVFISTLNQQNNNNNNNNHHVFQTMYMFHTCIIQHIQHIKISMTVHSLANVRKTRNTKLMSVYTKEKNIRSFTYKETSILYVFELVNPTIW
jgi:hypothetical protein